MFPLDQLPTPALLLDLDRLEANLAAMTERCRALGVSLRPHAKTHKCLEIADLQRESGATGLTVSTLEEARALVAGGHRDLTWAFPVILGRIEEARRLAERITLRLVADSPTAIDALEATGFPFRVWLKVDCGYHRAGVDPASELAVELARRLDDSATLRFDGLLSHSGHAYAVRGRESLARVAEEEREVMVTLAGRLRSAGIEVPGVSVGSTPAMSAVQGLAGVTEARPGNYALYDHSQVEMGSCTVADCAATVLASVVSCRPGSGQAVIDAGALALSKDPGVTADAGYGRLFADYESGTLDEKTRVRSLSQEHGIVGAEAPVGARLRVLPNHSCLTVACFDEFVVLRGEEIVDRWRIHRER